MKCVIRLAAGNDIAQALNFYASKGRGLATEFIAEVDRVLNLIERYPEVSHEIAAGYRRFPLNRFPYLVHYRIDDEGRVVEVVAVTHSSRRPGLWRSRAEEPLPEYAALCRAA